MREHILLGKEVELITKGTTPTTLGKEFTNSGIPFLRAQNVINGKVQIEEDLLFIDAETHNKELKRSQIRKGDLLLTIAGTIGRTAIVDVEKEGINCNQAVAIIRLGNSKIHPQFLKWFIESSNAQRQFSKGKVTATISNLSLTQIKKLKIPLPPLPTQKKIAALLDEADKLRRLNAAVLEKYDALTEAVFLEMFGDPVRNPNNFQVYKMDEICTKVTDGTHDTPERLKAGIKFITGKHIRPFQINYDNSDYVTEEVHRNIYRRCNPEFGDVLYTNIGVNLGTAALNIVEYEFSMKNVALLKPKKDVLIGRFLEHFLNSFNMKSRIKWMASIGGAQQFLSLTEIRRLKVIVPPLHLQTQFATRIQNIEAQKIKAQAALRKSEELFNALLQRSFSGKE
jgi:type I restriction enzyme S subunit